MSKWIAEFELEDGDTMPEHMDLEYKGAKIDFHCRPKEPILDKIRAEIEELDNKVCQQFLIEDVDKEVHHAYQDCLKIIDKYKAESGKEDEE